MTSHITCDQFADDLADLLDGDIAAGRRAALESHAVGCAECGALLADLRQLQGDAASLPQLTPSHDLWSGIAARIDAPVIPIGRRAESGKQRVTPWKRWVAGSAAAAALIAITAGITYYATVHVVGSRTVPNIAMVADTPSAALHSDSGPLVASTAHGAPAEPALAASSAENDDRQTPRVRPPRSRAQLVANGRDASAESSAEATYGREIARLHAIVERRRTQLDPVTIGIIERNLKIIDDAIAQCRAALARDPASRYLMQSLNSALENKVELLRTAAMLPSRT